MFYRHSDPQWVWDGLSRKSRYLLLGLPENNFRISNKEAARELEEEEILQYDINQSRYYHTYRLTSFGVEVLNIGKTTKDDNSQVQEDVYDPRDTEIETLREEIEAANARLERIAEIAHNLLYEPLWSVNISDLIKSMLSIARRES